MKLETTLPERPGLLHALPVLDLLVLVLIFPLLSPAMTPQSGIPVQRPETSFRMARLDKPIVLTVSLDAKQTPEIWIGRTRLGERNLATVMKQERTLRGGSGASAVLLRIDSSVSSGYQLELIDDLKTLGFQCYLATQPKGTNR